LPIDITKIDVVECARPCDRIAELILRLEGEEHDYGKKEENKRENKQYLEHPNEQRKADLKYACSHFTKNLKESKEFDNNKEKEKMNIKYDKVNLAKANENIEEKEEYTIKEIIKDNNIKKIRIF